MCATEPPFDNAYWDHNEEGVYVDVTTCEALFSSFDKFQSNTGWPSFLRPIQPAVVSEHDDHSSNMRRIEVKSKSSGNHLGHVFDDASTFGFSEGRRYCINSASLDFIPKEEMAAKGYIKELLYFPTTEIAVFGAGCFWCVEANFSKADLPGILHIDSGYTGGSHPHPTYEQVCSGTTGHVEVLRIIFDRRQVSYDTLLPLFWTCHNPTDAGGQFCDRGSQYRSVIFYADPAQMEKAHESRKQWQQEFSDPIATQIEPLGEFYPAEDYHQQYFQKQPEKYYSYRSASGRDEYLQAKWSLKKQ
jgi:peptide methionine sulfoxide reductase msrA/msrB